MRALHVVGVSDDGGRLLLAASADAERPSHWLPVDDRLQAAARGELMTDGRIESALTPKEIQARLRSGESVEAVAKAAGVPAARVRFYAGPVIGERDRIIDEARAATPRRDRGPAGRPLGEAVEARLATVVGLKPDTVQWLARRRDDGAWVVSLGYSARGGARTFEWLWVPTEHQLRSLSAAASRLTAPDPAPTRHRPPGRGRAAAAAPASRATRARPAAGATADRRAGAARSTGSRGAQRAAAARPAAPDPVTTAPSDAAPPTSGRAGRVAVPSWSDVLFGVSDDSGSKPVSNGRARGVNGRAKPGVAASAGRKPAGTGRSAARRQG